VEREALPVISKVGGSVDRVNAQLDKIDQAMDSAVDAADAVDQAVRTVSFAVKRPVQKLAGLSAGFAHGWASLRTRRDWRGAVDDAKEAAARREHDLDEELRVSHD
jgi:copper chaperone CopZ